MHGILNIYKPPQWTSRDVVNRVNRFVRPAKVGHAGTLDPLATGVLICCVGSGTRLIENVQNMPKRYLGQFELGKTSDTEDLEGTITELADAPIVTADQLAAVLPEFVGQIQQRPSSFSALKIDGKRAYDLARQGEAVELAPREVSIYEITLRGFEYPLFEIDVLCGGGTYMRALGRDIGERLDSGAVMTGLTRTAIGEFRLEDALPVEQLSAETVAANLAPLATAVAGMPQITLTPEELNEMRFARGIRPEMESAEVEVAALDEAGRLVAILTKRTDGSWKPAKNFVHTLE
ncbi:tRNA pseudouridine(55) synthase TruB [Blastopirellula sp. JC732]|uniref:tRNA pseudouridine synthase B n=1 Tax=Blastopirellula sediminis TaxID=2894196 RepID=A0A9X1SFE0_9BACT|nr:tRNA pseudouridine(55) synthase TruB [Blastopirellula sediminis]MCC9609567.1 tRNA pseudouridine(55) synthase TruB [Blastopirellula sediminis]MCC9627657.1 tRNA pseudouridine(55) synthase TruB [Blastopirellula sediminis]